MFFTLLATLDEAERDLAEQFYMTYNKRMYTIAYHILQNEQDAEDAVEDASIRIINNIAEFADVPYSKAEALIVLYIKSSAIDINRKRAKLPMLTVDSEEAPEVADDSESVEDNVITMEFIERLKQHIDALKLQYKEVLIYKYYYDKSDREIAELMHMNNNAVRTRLTRARDILRSEIERNGD